MAKTETKLDWAIIDTSTLTTPIAKQYARYQEAYREMKAERIAFEDAMIASIAAPTGKRVVIGYNFGKLSFAFAPDDGKAKSKAKATGTDFATLIRK